MIKSHLSDIANRYLFLIRAISGLLKFSDIWNVSESVQQLSFEQIFL
jgi:hypothetical protein